MKKFLWFLWPASFACFAVALAKPLSNYDLWWNLSAGRYIVETKSFLWTEVFSHTLNGTPWLNFEWLSQVIFYLIVKFTGFGGLYAARIILSLAAVGLLTWSVRQVGIKGPWLLIYGWLAFFLIQFRLNERAELFTFIFLAALVSYLIHLYKNPGSSLKNAAIVSFGGMVLWCNLHGGFVYGIGLLALLDLGAIWSKQDSRFIRNLHAMLGAAILGSLLNPFGVRLPFFIWDVMKIPSQTQDVITEWASTNLKQSWPFWCLLFLSSFLILRGILKKDRWAKLWLPPVMAFAFWGTLHVRNTALLPFVVFPFLGKWGTDMKELRIPQKLFDEIGMALGLVLVAYQLTTHRLPTVRGNTVSELLTPKRACQFLDDNFILGTLYNSFEYGGFVEWASGGGRQIFMDTRYLFGPMVLHEVGLFDGRDETEVKNKLSDYLESYKVNYALTRYPIYERKGVFEKLTPLNYMFPREDWALVYWDDAALVFLKRIPRFSLLISQYEYKFLRPYNSVQMEEMLKGKMLSVKDCLEELDRHEKEVGLTLNGSNMRDFVVSFASSPSKNR